MSLTANLFYLDIQTAGAYPSLESLQTDNPRLYQLWVDYAKRKTISHEDYVDVAGLSAEFGRVVCVSMGYYKDGELTFHSVYNRDEEKLMQDLATILAKVSSAFRLCGFCIKNFDIPFLFKKFLKYGIKVPACINTVGLKPWEISVVDISDIWKGIGSSVSTFDEMLCTLGVETSPADVTASSIHELYYSVDPNVEVIAPDGVDSFESEEDKIAEKIVAFGEGHIVDMSNVIDKINCLI